MTKKEFNAKVEELMQQYANEEIDAATYAQTMMELTTACQVDEE